MIVAFLDLLGFSWLAKNYPQIASDNLNEFNSILKTKYIDDKTDPIDTYPEYMQEFVKRNSVTSFQHVISISDSLVIGTQECNADDFIMQLSLLVASAAIRTLKPFKESFTNIENVQSNIVADANSNGEITYHKAFPVLFRGGICVGEDVCFFPQYSIYNGEMKYNSVNVLGQTYVEAYRLESTDKGPRIFCDSNLVNLLNDDVKSKIITTSKSNINEILWTYYACETCSCSSDKYINIFENGFRNLVQPTINLINYFNSIHSPEIEHYMQLLLLLIKGISLYASDNKLNFSR